MTFPAMPDPAADRVRLPIDSAAWSENDIIETQYPIADDLEPDAADPRPIRAPAAVINLRQRQKPAALPRILRSRNPLESVDSGRLGTVSRVVRQFEIG